MAKETEKYLPMYLRIKNWIARDISCGIYEPHHQLPSTAELMKMHGVSDGTVKRAIRELVYEGLAYTVSGKGCFVSDLAKPTGDPSRSRVVAMVYGRELNEFLGSIFYSRVLRGIETELSEAGLGFELVNLQLFSFSELLKARREGAFPGLLLATKLEPDEMSQLVIHGRATVSLFMEYAPVNGLYCLTNDEPAGGGKATRHLVEQGCGNLAAIMVMQQVSFAEQRMSSFLEVASALGNDRDDAVVESGKWTVGSGYVAMQRLLERNPEIDGVFAANDLMAIGAIGAALEAGRKIPEDLKIVGYDDIELARLFRPSLSTMRVDREAMGRRAIRELLRRVERPDPEFQIQKIAPRLMVRESTSAPSGKTTS